MARSVPTNCARITGLTGQSLPISGRAEFARFRDDLGEPVGKPVEATAKAPLGSGLRGTAWCLPQVHVQQRSRQSRTEAEMAAKNIYRALEGSCDGSIRTILTLLVARLGHLNPASRRSLDTERSRPRGQNQVLRLLRYARVVSGSCPDARREGGQKSALSRSSWSTHWLNARSSASTFPLRRSLGWAVCSLEPSRGRIPERKVQAGRK